MAATFIETIRRIVADPSVISRNPTLDSTLVTLLTDRINALTPDVTTWLTASDVVTSGADQPTGALAPNVTKNAIALGTDGFQFRLSKFRDGLQSTPRKIRRRNPSGVLFATPADRVRYVMADPTDGVMLLDQNLEVVRTFPNLIAAGTLASNQYRQAEAAAVGTVGVTELMFIACGAQHAVQILNYATGALVATIGVPGTAGLPDDAPTPGLTDPVSVSVDEVGERLFVACRSGDVAPDANDAGFVAEFDISTPATPVFVDYVVSGNGLYRLNNGQCRQPSDVLFIPTPGGVGAPPDRLWIANGLGDVAGFEQAAPGDPWFPSLVIEAQGPAWTLGPDTLATGTPPPVFAENAIDVFTDTASATRLFVSASRTAQVEVFRVSTGASAQPFGSHEATYGQRGLEDSMSYGSVLRAYSTPQQPNLTYGVFSQATGVVADDTTLPGDAVVTSVLVVADAGAGRVQRLTLPVYDDENTVTFTAASSTVPVQVVGWFLPADASFPAEYLTVEVRDPGDADATPVIAAGPWREVPKAGFSNTVMGLGMVRYQFRLRASLPRTAAVKAYSVPALGVLLRQQW